MLSLSKMKLKYKPRSLGDWCCCIWVLPDNRLWNFLEEN